MTRPPFEVADVIRIAGSRFRERSSLTWPQHKVLDAIVRCRTAALGGHRDQCSNCGHQAISYNSCRNRHCPKCQTNARDQWVRKRQQELLAVGYYHVVFSVPHLLVPLMWQNKRQLFALLFEASAAALLEVAADPRYLGAQAGLLSILHSWGQTLQPHPHIHCVVPGGGLSPDHTQWISSPSNFFLPVKVLSRVFRRKFVAGLRRAFRSHQLAFYGECLALANQSNFSAFLYRLSRQDWVVYAKPPLWRPGTCPPLPGPLHASRSNLQPSIARCYRECGRLPLEGLCAWQQTTYHDPLPGRVPAPFPPACLTQRISPHPLLRLAGQPCAQAIAAALPTPPPPFTAGHSGILIQHA